MKAYTVNGYAYNADTYCPACTTEALEDGILYSPTKDGEVDENGIPYDAIDTFGDTVFPIFADSEWDYVVHCDCGEEIETKVLIYS